MHDRPAAGGFPRVFVLQDNKYLCALTWRINCFIPTQSPALMRLAGLFCLKKLAEWRSAYGGSVVRLLLNLLEKGYVSFEPVMSKRTSSNEKPASLTVRSRFLPSIRNVAVYDSFLLATGHASRKCMPYFVADTSTSTRRSGCKQAINALVARSPLQSPGLVTGCDSSAPLAVILAAAIPAGAMR